MVESEIIPFPKKPNGDDLTEEEMAMTISQPDIGEKILELLPEETRREIHSLLFSQDGIIALINHANCVTKNLNDTKKWERSHDGDVKSVINKIRYLMNIAHENGKLGDFNTLLETFFVLDKPNVA